MFRLRLLLSALLIGPSLLLAFLGSTINNSQDARNKERIEFLKNQIKQLESQLSNIKGNKDNFINQIQARQGLVNNRNELIDQLNNGLQSLTTELQDLDIKNNQSLKTLELYRKDFEYAARRKYIQKLKSDRTYLADNQQWSSHVKNLVWNEQLNEYRIQRFQNYKKSLETILQRKQEIKNKIASQKDLLASQESEKSKIADDINLLNKDYQDLQSKIKEYKSTLDKYNKEMLQIEKLVDKTISEDVKTRIVTTTHTSANWNFPLQGGVISSPFGTFRDPKNKQLILKNNGIDIRSRESFVRSVSESQVVQIRQMDNGRFFLLTQSGEYYQVYSNLDKVFVKVGEKLERSSNLGELTSDASGMYNLHFEVWKGRTPVDPIGFVGR